MLDPVTRLAHARIVQWASHVEAGFEELGRRLLEALPEQDRDRLQSILAKGEGHEMLEQAQADLEQEIDELLVTMTRSERLQALADTERAAHEFYRRLLDEVRDPRLSKMMVGLLREESRHVGAIEELRKERP